MVGLFILNELINDKKIDKSNCGLYRDDGLLIVKKRSPIFIEQLRKSITKSFQKHNFKVIVEPSYYNFLLITTDLIRQLQLNTIEENNI